MILHKSLALGVFVVYADARLVLLITIPSLEARLGLITLGQRSKSHVPNRQIPDCIASLFQ
jgi:hypothetical protein